MLSKPVLQIKPIRKASLDTPIFQSANSTEVYQTTTSGNSHSRSGSCIIPAGGITFANRAVRCIVNLPICLLGISSPDGAGRNDGLPAPNKYRTAGGHSLSPIPQLQYHSSPSPAVRHSQRAIRSDRWADALIYCLDKVGFALPYIIGGCIISLLIYNLWKVL